MRVTSTRGKQVVMGKIRRISAAACAFYNVNFSFRLVLARFQACCRTHDVRPRKAVSFPFGRIPKMIRYSLTRSSRRRLGLGRYSIPVSVSRDGPYDPHRTTSIWLTSIGTMCIGLVKQSVQSRFRSISVLFLI